MNAARRARIEFFAAHAGYSNPSGRMLCAKALADAETFREWAEDRGTLSVEWMDDDECPFDDDAQTVEGLASGRYVNLGCIVRYQKPAGPLAGTRETVASLWGIVVESATDPYCRVVEAELVREVAE